MAWLKFALILLALLALALVGFMLGIDNRTPVSLRFLNKESPEAAVSWWLYGAFVAGMLTGLLFCGLSLARSKLNERRLTRSVRQQDRELHRLRNNANPEQQMA